MNYDVFISYRKKDIFKALIIYHELESCGLKVFLDISELDRGHYEEKIHEAIKQCKVCIVIVKDDQLLYEDGHETWVCKEIKWAQAEQKLILPILFDNYKWPNENYMNDMMKVVSKYHSIGFSEEYQEASFQKLFTILNKEGCKICKFKKNNITYSSRDIDINEFVQVNMQYIDEISKLSLAFHAGSDWFSEYEVKYRCLIQLMERNIPIKILINSAQAAESIGKHMRLKNFLYRSFDECVKSWQQVASFFPGKIEIRISEIPLMHCMCCFEMQFQYESQMMIHYYTYGNCDPSSNFDALFDGNNNYYALYESEFNYLWELAKPIQ